MFSGLIPPVGTVGDALANALAETTCPVEGFAEVLALAPDTCEP